MSHATETEQTGTGTPTIGTGWRVFQVVALVAALSWIVSYLWMGGYESLFSGSGRGIDVIGAYVFGLSPLVSVALLVLAVSPEQFGFLSGSDTKALVGRAVFVLLPLLWMVNVFIGTPMVNKLITDPVGPSKAVPVFAGVFFHVVFQHWFQSLAALVLGLVPDQFETLTESPTPAGIQCAVVDCG